MEMCPYYKGEYKTCNIYDSTQEEYQRVTYCMTSSYWKQCANYYKASFETKMAKKLRPNPDL